MLWSLIGVLWVLGCAEEVSAPETPPERDPSISLDRDSLSFQAIHVGVDPPHTVIILVENQGDDTLLLDELYFSGESAGHFQIGLLDPSASFIEPGERSEIPLTFAPTTAVLATAELVVESNDPAKPEARLSVEGEGIAPLVRVDAIDLGAPYLGCEQVVPVEVVNMGTADLLVSEVEVEGLSEARVMPDLQLSATVAPMKSLDLDLGYRRPRHHRRRGRAGGAQR